jgi:ADP-heptose:LPS heptosyltransferase
MHIQNRNLFRLNRIVLLKLPWLLRFFAILRKPSKRVLIIKTDAIGDYILFRNFIEILKTSETYKDYQVDLLGNILWQDLAIEYDSAFIHQFIFIKAANLYDKPRQTLKLGWQLFRNNYSVVFHPTYTRSFINDGLAALTAAKQIIGFESDNEDILPRYKVKTDKFYTTRLALPKNVYFEFERSKFFFDSVLNSNIQLSSTHIPASNTGKAGIVIFAGAGIIKREWGKENFLALIKLIRQHTAQPVYLAGGPADLPFGDYIEANLTQGEVINLIDKSTLPQLTEIIGNAELVIANDTSAIHIAVAAKTRSVCILGGGHFERFAPYPGYFEYGPVCVFEKMDCYYCNWDCIYKPAATEVYPCIGKISVTRVWDAVLPLLPR